MVVPIPNKTIKEEIKDLEFQKQELIKEIDSLETKLKNTQEILVKGDITLQCGTVTRIEPQFHLKLDPQARIDYSSIIAIIGSRRQNLQFGENYINTPFGGIGLPWNCRAIRLWERNSPQALD